METLLEHLMVEIRQMHKYRGLEVPRATVEDLLLQELPRQRSEKAAIRAVREKLHNIVAPYLGDPDYPAAMAALETAFASRDQASIRQVCVEIMQAHASTRERIPYLDEFYDRVFAVTGRPATILDLACGLHPLGWLWMSLPPETRYLAYDLHQPRLALIRRFFELVGVRGEVIHDDILVHPPQVRAEVAFFLKEAHRFEQRQRGCNRAFWLALPARWLVVSLPASSLTGKNDLADRQRRLVARMLTGLDWSVQEITVGSELVFVINKLNKESGA